jgi:predicted nucleic acid-binding protein
MSPEDVPDGPLLVDTDVVRYWVAEAKDGESFNELVVGHELAVSFATYGELLAIGHRARWGERRLTNLRNRLRNFVVLPYNAKVVELWAGMHAKVSGHLHKGGTNDLWTAACALSMSPQVPVVTNNLRDFQAIQRCFPELVIIHPSL